VGSCGSTHNHHDPIGDEGFERDAHGDSREDLIFSIELAHTLIQSVFQVDVGIPN
jgi:hypothetical protein